MSIGTKTLNARSETVTTTPAFRDSILTKCCLIPADRFYEWRKMGSVKQPYCFDVGEGEVFAFAGLWDEWTSPEGEIIESCTILTTEAELVADLRDRMPVIVPREKYDLWLDPDVNDFEAILDVVYTRKRIVGGTSRNEITSAQWDTCEQPRQVVGPKLVGGKAVH